MGLSYGSLLMSYRGDGGLQRGFKGGPAMGGQLISDLSEK
jgi:hypothetical protein